MKLVYSTVNMNFLFHPIFIVVLQYHLKSVQAGPLTPHGSTLNLDVGNNSLVASRPSSPAVCRYRGSVYDLGEEVPTEEPCLLCECKAAVVCKLRICPETPVPPPPGCIVVHKAKKCCAQLVCNQHLHESNRKFSREQKLPAENASLSSTSNEGKGFCVLDGTIYAEGSAMRSSSLCSYCFCIRGEMKCSSPQCVIPMNGCKPKFRSYACCPTNYDCVDSNATAILKSTPSSTPVPEFLKGCQVKGKRIAEGEPVLPLQLENQTNPCQTCFCMGGVVRCRPLECDRPLEGCRPITEDGHCCPDRYDCNAVTSTSESTITSEVATSKSESTRTTLSTSSFTIPIASTASVITTTEKIERLPEPSSQKMTTSKNPIGGGGTSSEDRINSSAARSRSTEGSREERRNKDRDDFVEKTSYEDDEKDDSSSLSYEEHVEQEPDSRLLNEEDTTDQSGSNSDMELDSDVLHTEENDLEVGTILLKADSHELTSDESSSEVPNSTFRPVGTDVPKISRNDFNIGSTPSSVQSTSSSSSKTEHATMASTASSSIPSSTVTTTTTTTTASSTTANAEDVEKSTNSAVETNSVRTPLEALNSSSGLNAVSDIESIGSTPVINQDVERTDAPISAVPIMTTSSTTVTTASISRSSNAGSSSSSSPSSQPMETTVKNVHFIPFGVEDAVMSPSSNDSLGFHEPAPPPAEAAYSNHALKISLIPPTPQKGYSSHSQLSRPSTDAPTISGNDTEQSTDLPIEPLTSAPLPVNKDGLRNAIMDVPVSTSLYNHGYYRHGIITDDSHQGSLELEISSRQPFPGQVFDDDGDHSLKLGINDAIVPPSSSPSQSFSHKILDSVMPPPPSQVASTTRPVPIASSSPQPTLSAGNPARTYSKFGIQDSAYYKYSYGSLPPLPPGAVRPAPPPVVNHHRYYNAPEQEHLLPQKSQSNFEQVVNEGDMTYDDDEEEEEEEEEGTTFEVQSAESPDDRFNYQQRPSNSESNLYGHTPPPTYVFPKNSPTVGEALARPTAPTTPPTKSPSKMQSNGTKISNRISPVSLSNPSNNRDRMGFKPAVAFPFALPKRPAGSEFNLGLKLSGCNIYGKMYNIGDIIRELSSSCVRCLCTEVGVQCSELSC